MGVQRIGVVGEEKSSTSSSVRAETHSIGGNGEGKDSSSSCSSSVRAFTERTTMHGCQSLMQPHYHVLRRLAWATLILLSCGFFLNIFIRGISRYLSYPSTIAVTVQSNARLSLPDVTVCNNNVFRRSFAEAQDAAILRGILQPHTITQEDIERLNTTDWMPFYFSARDPVDEFISDCMWNMEPIVCREHIQPSVSFAGACYTLSMTRFSTDMTRSTAGLRFQISINESEYLVATVPWADGVGVKLLFHDHGLMIDGENEIRVAPETDVYVAVRKSQMVRLGTPYNAQDCREVGKVNYTFSSVYSRPGCYMECFVRYFRDVVGCDYDGTIAGKRNCSMWEVNVNSGAAYAAAFSSRACVCEHPCRETIYSTDVTTLAHRDTLHARPSDAPRPVKRISVNVYYPTLDVPITSQQPAYDMNALVADIGGQMGLFLGASILTLTECLEFCLERVIKLVN